MANQIIIDIGAVANDGTGDPLRTAFNYVNNNFSNVWATGVANSNISFSGNKILTTNTNGNLVLAPNGTGKVQANVDIVPNANNTLSLGSLAQQWNTIYTQSLAVSGDTSFNNLTVDGNLTVVGNTIQIGNIVTDTKTIQLANTSTTANSANGSGITVGLNDNIATLLYNSSSNTWTTNIGITATGNVSGTYFIGNGSLLTGIASAYGNSNVAAYLPTYTGNISANNVLVSNAISSNDAYIKRGTFSGDPVSGSASMYVGSPTFTNLGTDVMAQFTGNVTNYAQLNLQNYGNSPTSSGDYIITADNGTDSTHFLDLGMTSSTWDGSQPNSLGNRLGPNDGYLYVQDGDFVLGTTDGTINTWKFDQDGNLTVPGAIIPAGNNTQSLGNATNQWSDLYVSNATIYMNNVPVSLTTGNVLTVNGEAVLSNDSNTNVTTTGNITANDVSADGWIYATIGVSTPQVQMNDGAGNSVNLLAGNGKLVYESTAGTDGGFVPSADNSETIGRSDQRWATVYANAFIGDGSQLTGITSLGNLTVDDYNIYNVAGQGVIISNFSFVDEAETAYVQIPAGNSTNDLNVVQEQGNVRLVANSAVWNFDTTGNLTIPNGGYINFVNTGGITQAVNEDLRFTVSDDEEDGWAIQSTVNDGAGNDLTRMQVRYDGVRINTDIPTNNYSFDFRDTGEFDVPKSIRGPVGGNLVISIGDQFGAGPTFIDLQTRSYVGDALISNIRIGDPNVTISTSSGAQNWSFGTDGNLSAPGAITATGTVSGQTLVATQSAANEGGEIQLALPSSGTTLTGNVIIDSYQNSIRFFESGNSRGMYVDVPNVSVSGQYAIGYRDVPQIALSGNVTANSITAGKHFYSTTAGNLQVTIPDNANVAFPLGATLTIVMNAAGNVIVAQGTGVSLYMAGSSSTGNRTVGAYGLASVMKVATDTWVISGTGVY